MADSFYKIRERQDFLSEPEAGLPAQVVVEAALVEVVQLSAVARPASSPCDAS
ncbi:hypothetical protein A2U01_0115785, partial [Trifolium medium]|nr:hypothetical protein [Trifolium medium]